MRPRPEKRYRVLAVTGHWLRALDPLEPGLASAVYSEWVEYEQEATMFPSLLYAEAVAADAPPFCAVPRTGHGLATWRALRDPNT